MLASNLVLKLIYMTEYNVPIVQEDGVTSHGHGPTIVLSESVNIK